MSNNFSMKQMVKDYLSCLSFFSLIFDRFEPDMLAFSGCYYGGGDKERTDLTKIRRRWKTLHVMLQCHLSLMIINCIRM